MFEVASLLGFFLGAFCAALLAASFAWAALQVRSRRLSLAGVEERPDDEEESVLLKDDGLSTISLWGRILAKLSPAGVLRRHLEDADLKWTVGRAAAAMLLCATLAAVVFFRIPWAPGSLVAFLTVLAGSAPYGYILSRRRKRFDQFSAMFPEALDSLARALKAGHPLSAGIEMLAYEYPQPLSGEMRRTREEWKLGTSWDHALDHLAQRLPLSEVRLFVAAVKMQNRMGGRLNDVLASLSETMRENAALESEMRSISAHSRITGLVLTLLPLAICLMMASVSSEYFGIMLEEPAGRMMLGGAVVSNLLAHAIMRRMSRVKT